MHIGPTPIDNLHRLSKMRELFRRMRDERVNHPSVSDETKLQVATYYGDFMEALDEAMRAIAKVHKLKPPAIERPANDHSA